MKAILVAVMMMTLTFGGLTMADNWTSSGEIVAACERETSEATRQHCLINADGWNTPESAIKSATIECKRKTQETERRNCFTNLDIFKQLIEGMYGTVPDASGAAAKGTVKINLNRLPAG